MPTSPPIACRAPSGRARVLIDVRQNAERLTMVVLYSLRTTDCPTLSTPIGWDEVATAVATADPTWLVFEAAAAVTRVRSGDASAPLA